MSKKRLMKLQVLKEPSVPMTNVFRGIISHMHAFESDRMNKELIDIDFNEAVEIML